MYVKAMRDIFVEAGMKGVKLEHMEAKGESS